MGIETVFAASATPPPGVAGSAEEVTWLKAEIAKGKAQHEQLVAQCSRLNQELHAIRSTVVAMEGLNPTPPSESPRESGAAASALLKKRMQSRKRVGVTDKESEGGGDKAVVAHPKSDKLAKRILDSLSKKAPFEGHDESDLVKLVAAMAPVAFKAGIDVMREGETGDLAYWVEVGELSVLIDKGANEVDTIAPDTVFGEVALVYDLERTATVRAKADCKMWALHRSMFQHILRDKAIAERKAKFTFLKTVQIFQTLSQRQISRIADVLDPVTVEAQTPVIAEGEEADAMYLLQEGQAVVSQVCTRACSNVHARTCTPRARPSAVHPLMARARHAASSRRRSSRATSSRRRPTARPRSCCACSRRATTLASGPSCTTRCARRR